MPCTLENLVVRDANMNYDASTWNLEQRGRGVHGMEMAKRQDA